MESITTEEKLEAKEEINRTSNRRGSVINPVAEMNRASNRRSSIMNLVGDSVNSLFMRQLTKINFDDILPTKGMEEIEEDGNENEKVEEKENKHVNKPTEQFLTLKKDIKKGKKPFLRKIFSEEHVMIRGLNIEDVD